MADYIIIKTQYIISFSHYSIPTRIYIDIEFVYYCYLTDFLGN